MSILICPSLLDDVLRRGANGRLLAQTAQHWRAYQKRVNLVEKKPDEDISLRNKDEDRESPANPTVCS
jgi:hypothetical protein